MDMDVVEASANLGFWDNYMINCIPTFSFIPEIKKETFTIYPNPATTEINIICNQSLATEMQFSIFDAMGREVMNSFWPIGINELKVDVNKFVPGIYLLSLQSKNGIVQTQKLMIN